MSARELVAATIAREYRLAADRLAAAVPAPDGHRWCADAQQGLGWYCADVLESVRYGASICLWREPRCWEDLTQLHIEARLTWSSSAGDLPDLSARRAILWVEQGPRFVGRWRDLLAPTSPFLHHDGLDALLADAIDRIAGALPLWRAKVPETES